MEVKKYSDLRFDLLRNALYNSAREGFFALLHRMVMFVVAFAGTGAAVNLLGDEPEKLISIFAGLLVAFAATADLVFDLGGSARVHAGLKQRFFSLLAELEVSAGDEDELKKIQKQMTSIYGEEPPIKRVVDAIAWNQARLSNEPDVTAEQLLRISFFQGILQHIWAFNSADFPLNTNEEQKSLTKPR
ncbi:MAG: hypothetical protein AAGA09_03355 [Pseudomonadota bacterium]